MLMTLLILFMILADAKFCLNRISKEDVGLLFVIMIVMIFSSSLDIYVYSLLR